MRLDAKIICEAQQGHTQAIHYLLNYFDPYITQLSKITTTDAKGISRTFVHTGIKEELQAFLIQVTLKFDYEKGLTKNEPTA